MSILTGAVIYVADKFLSQFLKDEGYGRLKKLLFPSRKYKHRLAQIIQETVDKYEKNYPAPADSVNFPFYHSEKLFELLNQHILFETHNSPLTTEEFRKNENIIVPTATELEYFYSIFIDRVNKDELLKRLHFDEKYKQKIFDIAASLKTLEEQNADILRKVTSLEKSNSIIDAQIKMLSNRFEVSLQVKAGYIPQGLEIYPSMEKVSPRSGYVDELMTVYETATWLLLQGNISMGKTQAALLIADRFTNKYWITLTSIEEKAIIEVMLQELSQYFTCPVTALDDITTLFNQIPTGALIILDDMPKLELSKNGWIKLQYILKVAASRAIKLLSTSNHLQINRLTKHISASIVTEQIIRNMNESEVHDILLAFGASAQTAMDLKGLVCKTATGHPTIVNRICSYLNSQHWQINERSLKDLFGSNYSSELDDDTFEQVFKTIQDADSRELLYRLKPVLGTITNEEISIVAAIQPAIRLPQEKVGLLTGIWLQKIKAGNYEISPLIRRLKQHNLSLTQFQQINHALGRRILSKQKLDPLTANKALLYFLSAEDFNQAGFIFITVLKESQENPTLFFDWGFSIYWRTTPLPDKMDLYVKSVIRYLQIKLFADKEDANTQYLQNDLEEITLQAARQNINVAHAAFFLSATYLIENPEKSAQFLLIYLKHAETLEKELLEELPAQVPIPIESLIWNHFQQVRTEADFDGWLTSFEQLSAIQRSRALQGEVHEVYSLLSCSKIYDHYAAQQQSDRSKAVALYTYIRQRAQSAQLSFLGACCMKFEIRCHCAQLQDPGAAERLFVTNKGLMANNPIAQFLVQDELGRQLYYMGQHALAMPYLLEAAVIDTSSIFTEKLDTYLVLNELLGQTDIRVAHHYAKLAYEFQQQNQYIDEVLSAKVIGEYAISCWQLQPSSEVFYLLANGLEKLFMSYKPLDEYQGTIIRYGHIMNFYYHTLAHRTLPDLENAPYTPPFRGCFSKSNEALLAAGYYYENRKFMLAYLMVSCFQLCNDHDQARKWAYTCLDLNKESKVNAFASLMTGMNIYFILDEKYEQAIDSEISVLRSINMVNGENAATTAAIDNPHLSDIIKDRPKVTFDSFDTHLFEYVLNFIVVNELWNYARTTDRQQLQRFAAQLQGFSRYFVDAKAVLTIVSAIEMLLDDQKVGKDILSIPLITGELSTPVQVLIYLIASFKHPGKVALELHLHLIRRLVMISETVGGDTALQLLTIPFMMDFWRQRVTDKPADFFEPRMLAEKGWQKIEQENGIKKIKKLLQILCYHLEIDPEGNIVAWLEA